MKMKFMQAGKVVISGLLLVLAANTSVAGVNPQVLAAPNAAPPSSSQQSIADTVLTWVNDALADANQAPAFRWIATPPVADDPRLQQADVGGKEKLLATGQLYSPVLRVVGPGSMFRRVGNAPAANTAVTTTPPPAVMSDLLLSAPTPAGMRLSDADIVWQIRALQGGEQRRLGGRSLALALPAGSYEITLLVGAYREQAVMEVMPGRQAAPAFAGSFGRLRATGSVEADWQVLTPDGQVVMEQHRSKQLNDIVPAGDYEVVATLGNASQTQRVRVGKGAVSVASFNLPTGKVSLVATLGNTVALRPMRWTVYRLDGGRREIAAPQRHSAMLVVSPGHYEAVANLDGRERRREFTVISGSSNHVVLAMD